MPEHEDPIPPTMIRLRQAPVFDPRPAVQGEQQQAPSLPKPAHSRLYYGRVRLPPAEGQAGAAATAAGAGRLQSQPSPSPTLHPKGNVGSRSLSCPRTGASSAGPQPAGLNQDPEDESSWSDPMAEVPAPASSPYQEIPALPTVYPSEEEFRDPFRYITSLEQLGLDWGVVKIVPPPGYRPPFSLDTSTLFFRPRRQNLNALLATTRAKALFHQGLKQFHAQCGTPNFSLYYKLEGVQVAWYEMYQALERRWQAEQQQRSPSGHDMSLDADGMERTAGSAHTRSSAAAETAAGPVNGFGKLATEDWIDLGIRDLGYPPALAVVVAGALLSLATHYLIPLHAYLSSPSFPAPTGMW
jgi:hypothetical protein